VNKDFIKALKTLCKKHDYTLTYKCEYCG